MKKGFKLIVPSFLAIIVCVLLLAGSTFALFTSDVTKNISVGSATVKVNAEFKADTLEVYSAKAVDNVQTTDELAGIIETGPFAGNYIYDLQTRTATVGNKEYHLFVNNASETATGALLDGDELSLKNMTPGDRVKVTLNIGNTSNVDIKYRVKVNLVSGLKLFEGLKIKLDNVLLQGVSKTGTWTLLEAGADITGIALEVYLPLLAGNEYQNLSTKVSFTVEAVQANAKTVDETLNTTINVSKPVTAEQAATTDQVLQDTAQLVTVTVPANAVSVSDQEDTTTSMEVKVKPQDTVSDLSTVITSEKVAQSYDLDVIIKTQTGEADPVETKYNNATALKVKMFVGTGLKGVKLYHKTDEFTKVASLEELDAKGEFYYDSETGYITLMTNSFSEYTVVYNKDLVVEQESATPGQASTFITYKATEVEGLYTDSNENSVVVNQSGEVEAFKGVIITKGNTSIKKSLPEFRDSVNEGNSYAGYTVTLTSDIDLNNIEWTPIGTSEHPFSGVFDGQNHTIANYKIRGSEKNSGLALFGFIEGTNNTDVATFTKDTPLSNFYNPSTYSVYLPSEDIFTCAIKNLNVAKADVNTTADGWTAAVVAYVKNATVANVHLSDSTLTATCKVGGIAGYLPDNYCCFITNCSTANNVTVTASAENHCTGILSRVSGTASHAIIANCINNATISCAGVNGAGIAGQAKGVLYYNDTNNGAVTSGTRAAGIATDCSGSVFIGCTNTGHIKAINTMSDSASSIAGIASYLASIGYNVIVNCQNSGTVEGTCAYSEYGAKIAGIVAGGVTASDTILNNANTGELINHAEGGKVYDICNLSSVPYVVEPADLAALNAAIATDNKYIKVTNSLSLSDGDTVVVNGQEKLEFVNSPAYLTIDLTNSNANSFVLMVNNTTVKLINGNGKIVTISGKGNTVIVEAGESIKSLRISSDDNQVASSLDFAGTADIILLNGAGLVNAEVKAGATVGRVCFGGTGTFVLTNRGTISHETEGQYGAEHTIDTITASNITIHNYGTIEAKKNSDDVCSYALLFYGGATVKFYAYEGSMVRQELHSAMAISGGTTIAFYYQEGAGLNIYGNDYTYPHTFNYGDSNITVTEMN